jgi:hypothetical protein
VPLGRGQEKDRHGQQEQREQRHRQRPAGHVHDPEDQPDKRVGITLVAHGKKILDHIRLCVMT